MRWILSSVVCVILIFSLTAHKTDVGVKGAKAVPRNVIFLVMDGTNSDVVTLARWYNGRSLNMDHLINGGVKTYSLESSITDSAAAGTALATGQKTVTDAIGMVPNEVNPALPPSGEKAPRTFKPVANLLEAAQEKGLATGIVSTSPIQHATPAAFSAHAVKRNDFDDIGEQQVYQGMDVVLGGGKQSLAPASILKDDKLKKVPFGVKEARQDHENLIDVIKKHGYTYVENKWDMERMPGDKMWGSFAYGDIAYDFDRKKLAPDQPSLSDMTKKAIDVLSQKNKGFFLFIEGSKIDWAAHKNDPVGMISEVLSFDHAVGEAMKFAKQDKQTMVVAVTDHGNSGLTIGAKTTNKTYAYTPIDKVINPLKKAKLTVSGAVSQLKKDRSNLEGVLKEYGLDDLTNGEMKKVESSVDVEGEMVKLLAARAHLGFTTHGHTGEDVFLYSYGPGKPTGLVNNIDISKYMAKYLQIDLAMTTKKRFVNAAEYYRRKGFMIKIERSDEENPVFMAKKRKLKIEYPENKNIMIKNGKIKKLNGVNVYNGRDFFVPMD
ncbi:alkaline phosphatase [Falsibacillus albus]|uniref:Alkaline phosphatase n=1 Tax=Falsibacillus albus TaxID=2478915 RepID=A0A3L7JVK3_9BACI|nr:alkaline phosphatase [Falsibacillus albus]RLQ94776.1 alkaline phosphatase [Falsibacillus albus]